MKDMATTRMLFTTAVLAAIAALIASPAQSHVMDVEGGGSASATATIEPGTIPYLSHGIGVDETLFAGQQSLGLTGDSALTRVEHKTTGAVDKLDPAIQTAIAEREAQVAAAQSSQGPIPYLSHGMGVDESQFSGQQSVGLTGDSPLGRVSAPEPEGLTGDGALSRVDKPVATAQSSSSGTDFDWTWIGVGLGFSAALVAAMTALYLSARQRGRVALP